MNCLDVIFGDSSVCRTELPLCDSSSIGFNMDGEALVGALIQDQYKLLLGPPDKGYLVSQDILTGPLWPNSTDVLVPELPHNAKVCNRDPHDQGCLFDVYSDPTESNNLASSLPDIFLTMLARLDEIQSGVYSPRRGVKDSRACEEAEARGNVWGPFIF